MQIVRALACVYACMTQPFQYLNICIHFCSVSTSRYKAFSNTIVEIKSAKDLETLVQYEFPWPQDAAQKGSTDWGKSESPVYKHSAIFMIERKSKAMLRMIKSRKLKLELHYRRY